MNIKKGFTLSEILIVLVVLGVLAMICLPILNNLRPNQNHIMFRKAYYLMSNMVYEMVNDEDLYPEPTTEDMQFYLGNTETATVKGKDYTGDTKFCELVASKLNTVTMDPDCTEKVFEDGAIPVYQFLTNDGMAWILPISKFDDEDDDKLYPVYVDVNGNKQPNCFYNEEDEEDCKSPDRFTINLKRDGRMTVDGTKEKEYLEKVAPMNEE